MTLVQGQTRPARRDRISEASTGPSSHKSNNRDHEDSLILDKPLI